MEPLSVRVLGLLIAIPLAASLGVILRFAMRKALSGPRRRGAIHT
jgi:hypothetical protein